MTGMRRLRYTVPRPDGWIALPVVADTEHDTERAVVAAPSDMPDTAQKRFAADVARVTQATARDDANRHRWVYVPDAATGTVVATMTATTGPRPNATVDDILRELQDGPAPAHTDPWRREYRATRLAARPAVSGQELIQVLPADGESAQLVEFYHATVITPEIGIVLDVSISTFDLARFPDLTAYGDGIVDGIRFARKVDAQ